MRYLNIIVCSRLAYFLAKIEIDCDIAIQMEDCEQIVSDDGMTIIYILNGIFVAKCVKTNRKEEWYNADGKLHRDNGPAAIWYENGQITTECWFRDGKLHRDGDLPAVIFYENGQIIRERWYRDDKQHRDDGPAVIWYKNGQKTREYWYRNGNLSGNALAYIWLANINKYSEVYIYYIATDTLDKFRDAVKGPLALELMRPLPIPIRDAIYEHYCAQ